MSRPTPSDLIRALGLVETPERLNIIRRWLDGGIDDAPAGAPGPRGPGVKRVVSVGSPKRLVVITVEQERAPETETAP